VPRPKALTRVIEAAASFGVERVELTNAWRVEKSYLSSPRLAPDALAHAARLGAEQGMTTHVPDVRVHRRLMELLDARWPVPGDDRRLIAHPTGTPIERVARSESLVLAIGPEGGWIQRELDTFVARGFTPVSLGERVLRVETAVAAALGQLAMLQRLMEK
jgi:RsmE family RNA methyltransferase